MTYLNCNDATLFVAEATPSPAGVNRLAAVLAGLENSGGLLRPMHLGEPDAPLGFGEVIDGLRAPFGGIAVDAALGCGPQAPLGELERPAAVMAVFPLYSKGGDPEDRDVLLGSARLWGADLFVELLRVAWPDCAVPVTTVRPRYQRWHSPAGGGGDRVVVQPPAPVRGRRHVRAGVTKTKGDGHRSPPMPNHRPGGRAWDACPSSGDRATRLGQGNPAAGAKLAAAPALERLFGVGAHSAADASGLAKVSAGIYKVRISAGAGKWNAVKHCCPIHSIRSYRHSESMQARVEIPAPTRFSTT